MIGVELDPHCHLTLKRVASADIIVLYKEFPHTDVVDRAEDVLDLVLATLRGEVKPVMSLYDCRQIESYPTTLPLMRGFVDRMKAMEGKDGILSVSIGHCFPYADVPEIGGASWSSPTATRRRPTRWRPSSARSSSRMRGKTAPRSFDVDGGDQRGARPQRPRRSSSPTRPTMPAAARPPTTRRSCAS